LYEWIGRLTKNERRMQTVLYWFRRMPRPFVEWMCRWVGLFLYAMGFALRRKIRENLFRLLPERTSGQIRRIAQQYFEHGVLTLYEIFIDVPSKSIGSRSRFTVEGEEHLRRVLENGKGAILFTPHVGNYFYYYWYFSQRYHCLTVVTAGSEELRPLYLRMQTLGCQGLDYDNTPPLTLLRKLRQHLREGGVVLLLGDFWRPNFPHALMFGRQTRSPRGAAQLALQEQVPVIPFYGYRERGLCHRMVIEPPVHLYKYFESSQTLEATNRLNGFLERAIRDCPEQWFYWFNVDRRFDLVGDRAVEDGGSKDEIDPVSVSS
jgi:lauroyl/myristoyl acyltransferase